MVSGEWNEALFAIRYSPLAFLPPSMILVRLGRWWGGFHHDHAGT